MATLHQQNHNRMARLMPKLLTMALGFPILRVLGPFVLAAWGYFCLHLPQSKAR
jgi:hypothetical protein